MPTIEWSQGLYDNQKDELFTATGGVTSYDCGIVGYHPVTLGAMWSGLYLMKGTKPATFAGMTNPSFLSGDKLMAWGRSGQLGVANSGALSVDISTQNLIITTITAPASLSGLATWFWYVVGDTFYGSVYHQFMGTVGLFGSGSDLEMYDTNIVAGSYYKLNPFTIGAPPLSWTY